MPTLFDEDSDQEAQKEDVEELNVNSNYAQNYSKWRQKEELHKLQARYGENVVLNLDQNEEDDDDESSSSSSDEGEEIPEEFEKNFYKTLACLKNKDPKIYKEDVKFFDDSNEKKENDDLMKKKKEKAMTLRDYERHIIVDKEGKLSDDEDQQKPRSSKFKKEDDELMNSFRNALQDDGEDFFLKDKSDTEKQKKKSYKEWLKGQAEDINEEEKKDLKPLKKFWNNPSLDENEKFLRDYILEKKYSDNCDTNVGSEYNKMLHDSDEDLSEDEKNINKQEEFEHKYNFRFEEPDPDFIKRYPRTLEGTYRKKDTKRSEKRAEVKARKEHEKLKRREELKQLKSLKRKEIEEKLEKLKEITGNDDINLNVADLDGDFDPDDYDKKMSQMFNDEYYAQDKDEMKPEFPEIDEELDVETNWDSYDPNTEVIAGGDPYYEGEADCEDPNFNMDADYNGEKSAQEEIESVKNRKRRRRSKFADLISKDKPKFDPKKYPKAQEYFDEYYALDYEDMIGDLPCRFKYRQTVPNDYGLTVEEILLADDRELNRWISLKRALQRKDDEVEYSDVQRYKQKAANEALKRKILPSLYKPIEEDENESEKEEDQEEGEGNEEQKSTKKRRRRKKKTQENEEVVGNENVEGNKVEAAVESKKNNKRKRKISAAENNNPETSENKNKTESTTKQLPAEQSSVSNEENNKRKKSKGNAGDQANESLSEQKESTNSDEPKKKKKKKETSENQASQSPAGQQAVNGDQVEKKKKKKKKKANQNQVQAAAKKVKKLEVSEEFIEKIKKENNGKLLSKKKIRKELFLERKRGKVLKEEVDNNPVLKIQNERLKAYGIKNPSKFKDKLKYTKKTK